MKHRTQILLEEWQYQGLREMARQVGSNLSELVRQWVTEKMQQRSRGSRKGLLALAGKVKDKSDVARRPDRYLAGI
mgnify:CR=1 FL=1